MPTLVCRSLAALSVAVILLATPSLAANPYTRARGDAVSALQNALRLADSVTACRDTQHDNLVSAVQRTRRLTPAEAAVEAEDLRLFLAGVALGGALSSCPTAMNTAITTAQSALSTMATTARGDDENDDHDVAWRQAPSGRSVGITAADVVVNKDYVDDTHSPAILFSMQGGEAVGLSGSQVRWQLAVKRKSQRWNKARQFNIGNTRVDRQVQSLGDVAISIRYSTFAREGFVAGPHVAALIGTVGRREVFRDELPFTLRDRTLHGADLHDADLHGADLHDADLQDDLHSNDLHGADLHGDAWSMRQAADRGRREQQRPTPMAPSAFEGLRRAIGNMATDSARKNAISTAAPRHFFSAQQLGALLDTLVTDSARLDVARAVVPRLVDRDDAYGLTARFTTSSAQRTFMALLAQ